MTKETEIKDPTELLIEKQTQDRKDLIKLRGLIRRNPSKQNFRTPKVLGYQRPLTQGQEMLRQLFGHNDEKLWGTGNNLPQVDGVLRTGGGLVKNGDITRRTGRMFGLR